MMQISADDFVSKISDTDNIVLSMKMNRVVEVELKISESGVENTYLGPDPIVLGYVSYMQFLGRVEELTGLRTLVRSYMQDRL